MPAHVPTSSHGRGILRVQVLSDLHAERGAASVPPVAEIETDADIVLIPGDTHHAPHAVQLLSGIFPSASVIATVGGNHEHYGTGMSIDDGIAAMRDQARLLSGQGREILVLEDEVRTVEVRGIPVRFVGCTFWTDFALFGDPTRDAARVANALNDFRYIRARARPGPEEHWPRPLDTAEVASRNAESRSFLAAVLSQPHEGPTFVLTHHCVSMRSVSARWKRDRVTAGFSSRADDLVALGATLWVHGHTHDSFAYQDEAGGTLVVCNPAGYMFGGSRENRAFDPRLVVDVRRGGPDRTWQAGITG